LAGAAGGNDQVVPQPPQCFHIETDRVGPIGVVRIAGDLAVPTGDLLETTVSQLTGATQAIVVDGRRIRRVRREAAAAAARVRRHCGAHGIWIGVALGLAPRATSAAEAFRRWDTFGTVDAAVRGASTYLETQRCHDLSTRVETILCTVAGLPAEDPRRQRAQHRAVIAALPLADTLARRFAGRGEPIDDLRQVAYAAMVRAVAAFDVSRGRPFTAFAVPTIVGELRRHFRDYCWAVHVPRTAQELRCLVTRYYGDAAQHLGHTPSSRELATYLGVSEDDLRVGLTAQTAYHAASLDGPPGPQREDTWAESLGDLDPNYARIDDREALRAIWPTLPVADQELLRLRFVDELTQSEIAMRFGVSQMQISRRLTTVLARLRQNLLSEL
jgi:RNA polymerase sigma-B factor